MNFKPKTWKVILTIILSLVLQGYLIYTKKIDLGFEKNNIILLIISLIAFYLFLSLFQRSNPKMVVMREETLRKMMQNNPQVQNK